MGLVHYPATIAPVSGSITVDSLHCADNAHETSGPLSATCSSSGWSGQTSQCECDVRYIEVEVDGRSVCQGQLNHFDCKNIITFTTTFSIQLWDAQVSLLSKCLGLCEIC